MHSGSVNVLIAMEDDPQYRLKINAISSSQAHSEVGQYGP
jgi:hypothetical protein